VVIPIDIIIISKGLKQRSDNQLRPSYLDFEIVIAFLNRLMNPGK